MFLTIFFAVPARLQCRRAGGDGSRAKFGLWAAISRSPVGHENSNLIEKLVSRRTEK